MEDTPTASIHGTTSREPKLASVQGQNIKKEGSTSFPATLRSPKSDIRNHVYRARKNQRMK